MEAQAGYPDFIKVRLKNTKLICLELGVGQVRRPVEGYPDVTKSPAVRNDKQSANIEPWIDPGHLPLVDT